MSERMARRTSRGFNHGLAAKVHSVHQHLSQYRGLERQHSFIHTHTHTHTYTKFVLERAGRHILSGESALGVFMKPPIELTVELVMHLLLAWSYEISCVRCTRRHWAQRVEDERGGGGQEVAHGGGGGGHMHLKAKEKRWAEHLTLMPAAMSAWRTFANVCHADNSLPSAMATTVCLACLHGSDASRYCAA